MAAPQGTTRPATSIGEDVLDFFTKIAGILTEASFKTAGEILEKVGNSAGNLVKKLEIIQDFGDPKKAGIQNLNALTTAFGALASKIPGIGPQLKEISDAIVNMSSVSKVETSIMGAFGDMLVGKMGSAYKGFAAQLVPAAEEAQKFQVTLQQLGQDQTIVRGLREQAQVVKDMGISYIDLQSAVETSIRSIDSSIRLTKDGTAAFDKNRESINLLLGFNKKFGIEMTDSSKIVNLFNSSYNKGADSAMVFSDSLLRFSRETGQEAKNVFKELSTNMDFFSTMSSQRALEAFASLEAFAKRTGQEVSKVINNLEQFDDLSSGYEKIGKINRLLMQFGSSIDPQAFIEASPEEKQRMLIEAISGASSAASAIGNENAKRMLAKAFVDATGLSMQSVNTLLSGNQTGKADMMAALQQKPEMKAYTAEERKALGIEASTSQDLQKVRDSLLQTVESVQFLARGMRKESELNIGIIQNLYQRLDKNIFKAVVQRDLGAFSSETKAVFEGVGKNLATAIRQSSSESDKLLQGIINAVDGLKTIGTGGGNTALTKDVKKTEKEPQNSPGSAAQGPN